MWTSSMMYTLYREETGMNFTFELSSLISSILLFDAPSISTTSIDIPAVIALHESQSLQGSKSLPLLPLLFFSQFIDFAIIRAVEVLPVPLGPTSKNACGNSLEAIIDKSLFLTDELSISAIVCGRYLK